MERYEPELARWEKECAAWKRSKNTTEEPPAEPDAPHAERSIVSDTTVEARFRHCRASTLNSHSAMFSQLACLGV